MVKDTKFYQKASIKKRKITDKLKCPNCGAIITNPEDGFCRKCMSGLDKKNYRDQIAQGW